MVGQREYQSYTDAIRDLAQIPIENASTLAEAVGSAAARQFCRGMATGGRYAGADSATQRFTDNVCGPFYNEPGNSPGGPGSPPFTGGQCDGVQYSVQFRVMGTVSGSSQSSPPSGFDGGTGEGPLSVIPAQLSPTIRGFSVISGTGVTIVSRYIGGDPSDLDYELIPTRVDGQPDSCGDPPAPINSPTVAEPYNFGDSENIPGVGPVATGTPTGIPGLPSIPIDAPEIPPVDGFIPEPLPDDFRPEDRGTSPAASAVPSENGNPENYPFPDPPVGDVWVGVCVGITNPEVLSSKIQGTDPDFITPNVLGNIRLRIQFDDGTIKLTNPYRVVSVTSVVFRPVAGVRVLGAFVNMDPTLTKLVTPLLARDEREDPALV